MDSGVLFLMLLLVAATGIWLIGLRKVDATETGVVTRLGKPVRNVGPGLTWIVPGIDELRLYDGRWQDIDPPLLTTVTQDRIPVAIDLYMRARIDNPTKALKAEDPLRQLLRYVIGPLTKKINNTPLDSLFEQGGISGELQQQVLSDAQAFANAFGVEVDQGPIPIQRLLPNDDVLKAFEGVKMAEQNKRKRIIDAEAEADATRLEQAAQGDWYGLTTAADALVQAAEKGGKPIVLLDPGAMFKGMLSNLGFGREKDDEAK